MAAKGFYVPKLINTPTTYGIITILLHWMLAILIIFMIGLGWYITTINYYHPYYHKLFTLHKSLGILTFLIALVNVIWFIANTKPDLPSNMSKWEIFAANSAHILLLFLTLLIPITGYFISTAEGASIQVFDWFEVPALFKQGHGYENLAGKVHAWLGYGTAGLVGIHALAALKHEFLNKDGTLRRMLGIRVK